MKPRDHRSTSSSSRWRVDFRFFACSTGTRSSTTRGAFLSLQATLFVQCVRARRTAWNLTAWAVRSAISEGTRRGQTKRRERGRCRSATLARREKKQKKKPLANASVRRASRRLRQTHLGLFFQPDVAVLEQPVEVIRAHGFRFPLVRVVHEVLHAAHRRDGAHDDGEGREGLERLRLVSGDDGATERDGAEGRREVSAARGGVSGSSGDARGRARANEDARFPAPGRRRSVRPAAVEGFVVSPGGAYHVRFCFGSRDAAGGLARGATLRSACEGRGRASGAITGRRVTSALTRASEWRAA